MLPYFPFDFIGGNRNEVVTLGVISLILFGLWLRAPVCLLMPLLMLDFRLDWRIMMLFEY